MRSLAPVSLKSTQILRPVGVPVPGELASHPGLIELFGDDEAVRERFEAEARRVLLPGGHVLFREGDPADHLYLLIHGRLQVSAERIDGTRHIVGEIGSGGICGERALLLSAPHSAMVRAQRDSELMELPREGFDRLIGRHPHAMLHVARTLVGRLSPTGTEMGGRSAVSTVAIVPLHGGAPLGPFARNLSDALAAFGTVFHLDAETTNAALGAGTAQVEFGEGEGKLMGWLHDQEIGHDFVVYEADPRLTRWSRRCIRQADRVLLLAEAGAEPSMGEVDEYLSHRIEAGRAAERELVLLRNSGGSYEDIVSPWLEGRRLLGHHHVDLGIDRDIQRLARTLAGRAVGVVFSGGGARTMAQIGAIRAIREAGIPIDRVGGVSGGSMFAAQVALGWDDQQMFEVTHELMVEGGSLLDFSVPIISVIKGKRWRRVLLEMFGSRRIETLRIPFFCVSTNLSRGELAVHREGLLWRWVRASLSIPGLGPPLVENGELYVDGSVLNNLPVDVMRDQSAGPVIALSVGSERGPSIEQVADHVPSKWSALRARLAGGDGTPDVPSIVDILIGATMVSGRRTSKAFEPMADLVIHPEASEYGLLEFSAMRKLVDIGYEYAVERLKDWPTG